MAFRQYIGARYVPQIYKNSQNPSSMEWENTEYEPFVIVSYLNNAYISRDQVPVNAGNPTQATSHWALFGYASGQIAYLQEQINGLKDIKAIKNSRKRFWYIGDSFLDAAQGWGYYMDLYCDKEDSYYTKQIGIGFVELQNMIEATNPPEDITDVIIIMGTNDTNASDLATLNAAVRSCISQIQAKVPDATIHVAYNFTYQVALNFGDANDHIPYASNVYRAIETACLGFNNVVFMRAPYYQLQFTEVISSDHVHPNATGYDLLARAIMNSVFGGGNATLIYQRSSSNVAFNLCQLDTVGISVSANGILYNDSDNPININAYLFTTLKNDAVFQTPVYPRYNQQFLIPNVVIELTKTDNSVQTITGAVHISPEGNLQILSTTAITGVKKVALPFGANRVVHYLQQS